MASVKHYAVTATVIGLFLTGLAVWPDAQAETEQPVTKQAQSDFSGDPNKPRRHFRVRGVADINAEQREADYQKIRALLQSGYAASGDDTAKNYPKWRRLNVAPYRSATHGQRFVNNYVNRAGAAYAKAEESGMLPVGSIVVKDSFVSMEGGATKPGPLFVMEKMPAGFNYVSGDWRYTMIMPDGSVFGETKGANSERVEFCISCHLAREKYDHLFYVPKEYRPK